MDDRLGGLDEEEKESPTSSASTAVRRVKN
jgi:hypothetical protein